MPWKQTGLARTTGDQGQMTSLIEHNTLSDLDCILHSINTMNMERLIAAVYHESPLWDKRNKLHANRMVVDKCLKTISQDMEIEGEFYSEFEN